MFQVVEVNARVVYTIQSEIEKLADKVEKKVSIAFLLVNLGYLVIQDFFLEFQFVILPLFSSSFLVSRVVLF